MGDQGKAAGSRSRVSVEAGEVQSACIEIGARRNELTGTAIHGAKRNPRRTNCRLASTNTAVALRSALRGYRGTVLRST